MILSVEEREALHGAIHRLEQRWQNAALDDPDWHIYDRLPFWEFVEGLRRADELASGRRFVDLGCGIGTNMAIAYHLGWQVYGVDKRAEYVEAARELLPEARIEQIDLTLIAELDADVVYMYRPARSDELEDELEEHVLSIVSTGTVCFWPLRRDPEVWVV